MFNIKRLKITLTGLLQGIGFRPFVYRLAIQYQQAGWVANDNQHVVIEIEGDSQQQRLFLTALQQQVPGCGRISEITQTELAVLGETQFQLKASLRLDTAKSLFVCPDLAVCQDCVTELFDPTHRRYQHPFISCCHCGPRYSLMYRLPYDRPNTTLDDFPLCSHCQTEYQDPSNRRFHAQTIACPDCGPQLYFTDARGTVLQHKQAAFTATIAALKAGQIVAVKGVGGFQLMVDATNQQAILRLRQRKQRVSKPFALMVGSIAEARKLCELSEIEKQLLQSSAAPIVLAKAKKNLPLAQSVAPQQALLGIMLPYTPIHHLLLAEFKKPLIATSANLSGEPICIDNKQAINKLARIADFFLCHDRVILRPLDDSIVLVMADKPTVLRRARGYVPAPISLKNRTVSFLKDCQSYATLAVGGQLKNTVAIAQNNQVILSQHLGDLEHLETAQQFEKTIADLSDFYAIQPQQVICDSHSDYVSSQYAHRLMLPLQTVQHHYAHVLSCMAEHQLEPPVLGVAWDGTGLGTDNQLWGGEFLAIKEVAMMTASPSKHWQSCAKADFQRIAHLRPFPLVGGFQAIKEPRRAALGLLYAGLGESLFSAPYRHLLTAFSEVELKLLQAMLRKQINCPSTSSIGRLFDAVASLLGLCQISEFEGQAAMALEQIAMTEVDSAGYPFSFIEGEVLIMDWQPLLLGILADLAVLDRARIAAKLHQTLAQMLFAVADRVDRFLNPEKSIVLSGGCFQNAYLVETIERLNLSYGYQLFRHQQVPPNDGGLALGQIYHQIAFKR
jgi:hydrogenase maturation protein HypF